MSIALSGAQMGTRMGVKQLSAPWQPGQFTDLLPGLATETDVFDAAFRLVHDQYAWRGYMTPSPSRRRLSFHNALPSTKVFVARRSGSVVGTVTLVKDSLFRLPLDELYEAEVSVLRERGRRIAEVSALATSSECRRAGPAVVLHLMRMLVLYAIELGGLDDLCIAVNPRHVEFYRACLRFETIGSERSYVKVNGAPAVALRLDLDIVRGICAQVRHDDDPNEIHSFFFARDNAVPVLARLRADLPRAHFRRAEFVEFFGDETLLRQMPPEMREKIEGFYAPVGLERPCELTREFAPALAIA